MVALALAPLPSTQACTVDPTTTNHMRGQFREVSNNSAWSWFMDQRSIVDSG
jgi:hypothetical protein